MSFNKISSFHIPELYDSFTSLLSIENAAKASTISETFFYSSLRNRMENEPKIFCWIRETSIECIREIQMIFNSLNLAIIFFTGKKLIDEAADTFSIKFLDGSSHSSTLKLISLSLTIGTALCLSIYNLKHVSPSLSPQKIQSIKKKGIGRNQHALKQVAISQTHSRQQKCARILHMTKLILNIALSLFIKNRTLALISVAGSIYSLWAERMLKRTTFSAEKINPYGTNHDIQRLKSSYHILMIPQIESNNDLKCAICLEQDTEKKIMFCTHHIFHKRCIFDYVLNKSDDLFEFKSIQKVKIDRYHNGSYIDSSFNYHITMASDKLPRCPLCMIAPQQHTCEFEVKERMNGMFNAHVIINRPPVDKQCLFENLYAIYNIAQAGLTCFQRHGELGAKIFNIQEAMLIIDFIGYAISSYYLYDKINKTYKLGDSLWFKALAITAFIASGTATYFTLLQFNAYLKSAIILKEVLLQLDISPEILQRINISQRSPLTHQLMQALYVNRMVSMIALCFFSTQWKQNLISIFAQFVSFIGISKLNWIELTQTWDYPVRHLVSKGGSWPYKKTTSFEKLTLTTHTLIKGSNPLKSTVQSIFKASNSFFDGSDWSKFWKVSYTNGVEIRRELFYRVRLIKNPFQMFDPSCSSTLTDYSLNVLDAVYGSVRTQVNVPNC